MTLVVRTDLHPDENAQVHNSLIAELEDAIRSGSKEKRVDTLIPTLTMNDRRLPNRDVQWT